MADIFAVISKAIFEKQAKGLDAGDVHAISSYDSNPTAFAPLADGGTLYVVTARPGDVLWLVAKLDQPKLKGGKWVAAANTTPITDITPLVKQLKFGSGNGIKAKPGQLGMSLQTPRALSDADVALIEAQLEGGKPSKKSVAAKPAAAAKTTRASLKQTISKDLEAALAAGSEADFLVYADALAERGDPRGELIHIQHRLAKRKSDKLWAAEATLLKDHADVLLGPLAKGRSGLTWKLGFVESANLRSAGKVNFVRSDFDAILAHPSMKYVRDLSVEVGYNAGPAVMLALASTPRPALRSLTIYQGYMGGDDDDESATKKPTYAAEYDSHEHKQASGLWKAIAGVEKLRVCGWNLFHGIALPELRELDIEGYPLCSTPMQLPKLETLKWTLDCDDTGTGVDFMVETIAVAWKSKTPKLTSLDFKGCDAVGYEDYEMLLEDSGEEEPDDGEVEGGHLSYVLRRDKSFKKIVNQLDVLVLPREKLKTKAAIAKWLKG